MTREDLARTFQAERGYLLGVAYRLLGTVTDAEDAVQEAWVRLLETDATEDAASAVHAPSQSGPNRTTWMPGSTAGPSRPFSGPRKPVASTNWSRSSIPMWCSSPMAADGCGQSRSHCLAQGRWHECSSIFDVSVRTWYCTRLR